MSIRLHLAPLALALLAATSAPTAFAADIPALYQSSYDLEAVQDYAGALEKIEAMRAAGEDDYVVHLRRGWLLYLVGRYADSAVAYQEAAKRSPKSVEAQAGLALPLMALRRWADAEKACKQALKLAPGNYLGQTRLAYVLYSAGRYAEAESQYAELVVNYPSDVEMRAGLGWSQLKQGKTAAARSSFAEVVRTAPSHVSAAQGMAALGD